MMTLTEGLVANGISATHPAYDGVTIAVAPWWLKRAWPKGVKAMALPRSIYAREDVFGKIAAGEAAVLLRHESVHIEQWRRYGRVGFLAKYLGDYLRLRAAGLPHPAAYRAIPFEREASSRSE